MYEIRTALSYLVPRKGQLSSTVVGSIAVLVILAISWLVLVFFSTTEGLERMWAEKISSALGPVQITPSSDYFQQKFSFTGDTCLERLSLASKEPGHPLNPVTKALNQQQIPWRRFESTVGHIALPSLYTQPGKSVSQYTSLLGTSSLKASSLSLLTEITPPEITRLITLLSSSTKTGQELIRNALSHLENIEVITQDGNRSRATIEGDHIYITSLDKRFPLSLPSAPYSIVHAQTTSPPHLFTPKLSFIKGLGYPLLLSKQMRSHGIRLLDTGLFEFQGATITGAEPLTLPFYVAGFFDPGILPIGSKLGLTSITAVQTIQPQLIPDEPLSGSGIIVDDPDSLSIVTDLLKDSPFKAQRFDNYDTTRELFGQFKSEKNLFTLISFIIIAVACSNIFSMLFILAHDRRKEIAIFRALGASKTSIATIFVCTGLALGLIGSLLGSLLAFITLDHLPELLSLIAKLQGQELLQQGFYGEISRQTLSTYPLIFTIVAVSLTSALAGALAALRACHTNVSQALKG